MRPKLTLSLLRAFAYSNAFPAGISAAERFWRAVDVGAPDECWRWRGEIGQSGYGRLKINRHNYPATHISAVLAGKVELPEGWMWCHTCDHKWCVNPGHLFPGTASDNIQDARAKGRLASGDRHPSKVRPGYLPTGKKHPNARLTEAAVLDARASYANGETYTSIAKRLGVARCSIYRAVIKQTWRHVA